MTGRQDRPRLIDYERVLGRDERADLRSVRESRTVLRASGLDPDDLDAVEDAYEIALFDAAGT